MFWYFYIPCTCEYTTASTHRYTLNVLYEFANPELHTQKSRKSIFQVCFGLLPSDVPILLRSLTKRWWFCRTVDQTCDEFMIQGRQCLLIQGNEKKSFLNVFWLWRETNLVLNINVLTHCVCTPACLCACMYERRSGDTLILFEWLWMQSVTLLWKSDEEEGDLKECVGWRTLKSDDL